MTIDGEGMAGAVALLTVFLVLAWDAWKKSVEK